MADDKKSATPSQRLNRLKASRKRRQPAKNDNATTSGAERLDASGDQAKVQDTGSQPNAARARGRRNLRADRRQTRWTVLRRVARILMQTPDDGTGLVEGTPFKKSGVAALMQLLEERIGGEDKPRTRSAKVVHRMLTEGAETDSELIHGARVTQLQMMSRMMQRMRSEGPAGRRGRRRERLETQ